MRLLGDRKWRIFQDREGQNEGRVRWGGKAAGGGVGEAGEESRE